MSEQTPPTGQQPGARSEPGDDGKGTIGLADRLGDAAPDTNQAKAEPMPPTSAHPDPEGTGPHTDPPAAPELDDMGAGRAQSGMPSPPGLTAPGVSTSSDTERGPGEAPDARG